MEQGKGSEGGGCADPNVLTTKIVSHRGDSRT